MYIIKLKQTIELPRQRTQKQQISSAFLPVNQSKQEGHEYSDSFRSLMNKVLKRIYHKNNFIQIKKRKSFGPFENNKNSQDSIFQKEDTNILEKRIRRAFNQQNKLKINGMGKTQNISNLLQISPKSNIYNKTSVSFINNKKHRRSIEFQRTKSLSSQVVHSQLSQGKNGTQNTFYNSRYSKRQLKKLTIENKMLNGVSLIPKIIAKDNYDKMHDLFKCLQEPKPIKIQLKQKIMNKKMTQRESYNRKWFFHHQQNTQIENEQAPKFQPWITKQHQSNQDYFSNFKPNF